MTPRPTGTRTPDAGARPRTAWRRPSLFLAAAVAALSAAGCKTEPILPRDSSRDPSAEKATRNEREAEETIRRAFQCYAAWDLDGAYSLICKQDQAKISRADFKKGSEVNKAQLIRTAREAKIVQSGESILPDGTPYVTVVVKVEPGEILPYSAIREPEGWRLILVDTLRARQAR